jgi:hypothetical protein
MPGQLVVHAEIVLEGDRGQRLVLGLDRHAFLGFDGLVQAVRPAPARHGAAGELVDDDHLAVADDVFHIALVETGRARASRHSGGGPHPCWRRRTGSRPRRSSRVSSRQILDAPAHLRSDAPAWPFRPPRNRPALSSFSWRVSLGTISLTRTYSSGFPRPDRR